MRRWLLWKLEGKIACKRLPGMLLASAVLLLAAALLAAGIYRLFYRETAPVQVTIALVEEEETSPLTELLVSFVEGMEGISDVCDFVWTDEEDAFSMLQKGQAAAVLVLPAQMAEGILYGDNVPMQVYFPDTPGMDSLLLQEMAEAGVSMLSVAQAEIYGAADTAAAYGDLGNVSVLEGEIDRANLSFALERLALFAEKEAESTGSVSLLSYAIAGGLFLFLLLLGAVCMPVFAMGSRTSANLLRRSGTGYVFQNFGKWFWGFITMTVCAVFLALIMQVIAACLGAGMLLPRTWGGVLACILLLWCASTFAFFLFSLTGEEASAMLLLCLCSLALLFVSGGLVPSVFLPAVLARIGAFLPTAFMTEAASSLLAGSLSAGATGGLSAGTLSAGTSGILAHYGAAFLGLGLLCSLLRKGARA